MSKIIVLGAGMCGLAAGMLLRRDGHEVTVLERDPEPAPYSPEEAWERWPRDGVTQFRQAHLLMSRGRLALEEAFPNVLTEISAAADLGSAGGAMAMSGSSRSTPAGR
jgi:2-polyprenyl-6-methoxyphenol hydroxylase-like FAD-dependent oxidoreductase